MGLPSRFVFNALFDIIYSFFDNDLSVMRLSVIGDFYRRSRYRDYLDFLNQHWTLEVYDHR